MLICGIKVSHDGGIAVIADGRLLFSIEMEKLKNGRRYSDLGDLAEIAELLRAQGVDPRDIDRFVVDGWHTGSPEAGYHVATRRHGVEFLLPTASYMPDSTPSGVLSGLEFAGVPGTALADGYVSYTHASNHALGAYCTSPFARRREDALVLVWDGGMLPWLFEVDAAQGTVTRRSPVMTLVGNTFTGFCSQLEPYARDQATMTEAEFLRQQLEVPGKAMAYAALGSVDASAFEIFDALLGELDGVNEKVAFHLGRQAATRRDELFPGLSSADLIATFQAYLGQRLISGLAQYLNRTDRTAPNLCLAGGCALNIKWNRALADSGLFAEVWIPPFPNDSGAALGTASCEMVRQGDGLALDWNVYSGPELDQTGPAPGWSARPCDEAQLAQLLAAENEPVVVLHGRAELGPRALGNRSILSPATDLSMKATLNKIKGREHYRPVAPLCLQEHAATVFRPGGTDPYMLFEHDIRTEWADRVPAVAHLDGSARLQTITADTPGTVAGRILTEYHRLTGIPVLCNTSANLAGSGFLPGVGSATRWGGTKYVWSGAVLYTQDGTV